MDSSELRDELQKLKDSGQLRANPIIIATVHAIVAVMSDVMLRVSEAAALHVAAEVAALDVGDVQAEADGSGRLFVGASKTDQEGRGADRLRVGGAQSLAAGGASLVEMQTAGRWQSPAMPGHYARGQLTARGAVARVRYGRG